MLVLVLIGAVTLFCVTVYAIGLSERKLREERDKNLLERLLKAYDWDVTKHVRDGHTIRLG